MLNRKLKKTDIPDDTLTKSFEYLKPTDLTKAARVCKRWRNLLIINTDIWKTSIFKSNKMQLLNTALYKEIVGTGNTRSINRYFLMGANPNTDVIGNVDKKYHLGYSGFFKNGSLLSIAANRARKNNQIQNIKVLLCYGANPMEPSTFEEFWSEARGSIVFPHSKIGTEPPVDSALNKKVKTILSKEMIVFSIGNNRPANEITKLTNQYNKYKHEEDKHYKCVIM